MTGSPQGLAFLSEVELNIALLRSRLILDVASAKRKFSFCKAYIFRALNYILCPETSISPFLSGHARQMQASMFPVFGKCLHQENDASD